MRTIQSTAAAALLLASAGMAAAQVVIETVQIGHPGNVGETSGNSVNMFGNAFGFGEPRVCGAVGYIYEIGKYEVTAAQYVAFLNAVAANDPYSLYNTFAMPPGEPLTTSIVRTGVAGSYSYSVAPDYANRPVGGIGWGDAVRFANWMHNGQPTGVLTGNPAQDAGLTEDGSYFINGATTNPTMQNVVRKPGATWVLPTEDEWYKAAYHKNNGATGNYWDLPMRGDLSTFGVYPSNDVIDPDPGFSANFWQATSTTLDDDCIGPPYFRTPIGEFENSYSEYGTFDQGGNIWEWTESRPSVAGTVTSKRVMRGGSFYNLLESFEQMHSAWRASDFTAAQVARFGLRMARMISNDCDGNGINDQLDLASGASRDDNFNGWPDQCDIARGTSRDCNSNGTPDEAEVGAVVPPPYQWDDGVREDNLGLDGGGSMVWLNQFEVLPGRSTVASVSVSFGFVANGTPVDAYLWSDPNGDGSPTDAVLLASGHSTVSQMSTDNLKLIDVPDTAVGPVGTKFFVGVRIQHPPDNYPANLDVSSNLTSTPAKSWLIASTTGAVDPNNLGLAPFIGTLPAFGFAGNWIVRANPAVTVAQVADANNNGIPDSCETCRADFNQSGTVTVQDIFDFLAAYFANLPAADFNGVGGLSVQDIFDYLAAYFAGCQ